MNYFSFCLICLLLLCLQISCKQSLQPELGRLIRESLIEDTLISRLYELKEPYMDSLYTTERSYYLDMCQHCIYYYARNAKKSGPFVCFYHNGDTMIIGSFQKNKMEGVWKWFHRNGKISKTETYLDDHFYGHVYTFDPQGRLTNYFLGVDSISFGAYYNSNGDIDEVKGDVPFVFAWTNDNKTTKHISVGDHLKGNLILATTRGINIRLELDSSMTDFHAFDNFYFENIQYYKPGVYGFSFDAIKSGTYNIAFKLDYQNSTDKINRIMTYIQPMIVSE